MAAHLEKDAVTGTSTTGHEWDGIKELNTPLPKWWLQLFYITIIWSFAYFVVYPSWPLVSSYTKGVFGWSSRAAVEEDLAALRKRRGEQAAALEKASLDDIRKSPDMSRIALAQGKAAFGDNCAPCHGNGGVGGKGYPNLIDDEWIWGGKLDDIHTTITNGIRWTANNDTRLSDMVGFVKQGMLKKDEADAAIEYVRSIAKLDVAQGADLAKGKKVFADTCSSCHGDDGKGKPEVGAPDLTDAIWLFGSDRQSMTETVYNGRAGVMPAWTGRLDPVTIKALTVYVHTLGGGK
ncbi:MAG TPA: cytochrome-c oxidase, cbb3-type subunit III [Beijerinckiaceae bacterium]|nr:cytochrome-c oxidase, cbb3-type subunit III [Beijerinckiaceae bacterium]